VGAALLPGGLLLAALPDAPRFAPALVDAAVLVLLGGTFARR